MILIKLNISVIYCWLIQFMHNIIGLLLSLLVYQLSLGIFTRQINSITQMKQYQIAHKACFIVNQNKIIKMSEHGLKSPQYEQLLEVRKKLFADSTTKNNYQNSSKRKQIPTSPILHTPAKKIQLKRHLKTEIASTTPRGVKEARLKTSPNGRSPLSRFQEHRTSTFNPHHASRACGTTLGEEGSNSRHYNFRSNQSAKTDTDLLPSDKKNSLAYSRIYRDSKINKSVSNSKSKDLLSKSRKKMLFTVYNSKEKSMKKNGHNNKIEYQIPYRFHSSVTIDLLGHSPSKNNYSKSKQKNQDYSTDKVKTSNARPVAFHSLMNFQDPRIPKALTKIQTFKFVFEYFQKSEIIEKLKIYAHQKEPECKWVLLIVDEVFKRMKKYSSFQ